MGIKTNKLIIGVVIGIILVSTTVYSAIAVDNSRQADKIYNGLSQELINNAINFGKYNKNLPYLTFAQDWNTQAGGGIVFDYDKAYAVCKTPYFVLAERARSAVKIGKDLTPYEINLILASSKDKLTFMVKFYGEEINFYGEQSYTALIEQGDTRIYASSASITVLEKTDKGTEASPIYKAGGSFELDTSNLDYTQNFDFVLVPIEGPNLRFPIYVSRIH